MQSHQSEEEEDAAFWTVLKGWAAIAHTEIKISGDFSLHSLVAFLFYISHALHHKRIERFED